MIRGVCFDMDGLLFDTESLGADKMRDAVALQGYQLDSVPWEECLGQNDASVKAALRRWFAGIDTERFFADWWSLMLKHIREKGVPEKAGAREALESLRTHGFRTALATSSSVGTVQEYLDINGFGPLFDVIVTGDRVAHGKPAPDIYLRAAELLQLAPAECAGVEDSLNGVKAVRAAGMRSVMIPDLLPYGPDFAPYVDVRLNSLHELLGALEEKE